MAIFFSRSIGALPFWPHVYDDPVSWKNIRIARHVHVNFVWMWVWSSLFFFRTRTIPCVIAPQAQLSWDMLLPSEREILTGKRDEPSHGGYDELFRNADITSDEGRVCVLNQHPVKHPTTSHSDGSLPTFLAAGNQKIWSYARQRWLTATEKWVAMGWPGNPLTAKLLNRPLANALACQGHERIGNGMHVFNVVLVLLSLMASIELAPVEPAKTVDK